MFPHIPQLVRLRKDRDEKSALGDVIFNSSFASPAGTLKMSDLRCSTEKNESLDRKFPAARSWQ